MSVRLPDCQALPYPASVSTLHTIDWGDVPTWVSAITTAGALIAAGFVVRIELRRDKRQTDAAERAEQADQVAVWHQAYPRVGVVIHNGSVLPIYSVAVSFDCNDTLVRVALDQPVPPGDYLIHYPAAMAVHAGEAALEITFEDTAGRSWLRAADGRLVRLPPDESGRMFEMATLRTAILPPK